MGATLLAMAVASGISFNAVSADNTVPANSGQSANIATDGQSGTSTAKFNVINKDPNAGKLTLTAVPGYDFGDEDYNTLQTKGDTLMAKSAAADDHLGVADFRDTHTEWHVSAKVDAFKNTKGDTITATSLNLGLDTVSSAEGTPAAQVAADAKNITGTDTIVLSADATQGFGNTSVTVSDATLTLPQHAAIQTGAYQATINWTLTAGTPATIPAATEGE